MRSTHRLATWGFSESAERFLRAETFCERGARGGAEILVKREQRPPIGPPASVGRPWLQDPHLRNWKAFTNHESEPQRLR